MKEIIVKKIIVEICGYRYSSFSRVLFQSLICAHVQLYPRQEYTHHNLLLKLYHFITVLE